MKFFSLFVLSFFIYSYCHSQSPGGVSGGITGWYKGDAGVSTSGPNVTGWADQSGNARNASQGNGAKRPSVNATAFNYNPAISLDGQTNYLDLPDQMASTVTALTAFVVARQTATTRDANGVLLTGQANVSGTGGGYGIFSANAGNTIFGFAVNDYATNNVVNATNLSSPTIMTGNFNGSSAGNLQYFNNGTLIGTDPYAGAVGDNGPSYIGSGESAGGYCFYGDIAEVAVYSVGISSANMTKIESYLALKYGITKTGNYENSSATNLYTPTAPYNNNIIGIGRDDNSTLYQKQSKNYNDTAQIFISTLAASNSANAGTFSSNNQYVVMGANTGRMLGINIERPSSIYARIEREWKVVNTGFSSTFNVLLRLHANAQGGMSTTNLRLLVDTDGDFTNATVYSSADGLTFTYSNPSVTISGINNTMIPANSIRYITLASISNATPLPIELMSFEALLCNNEICVTWQTASEKNNMLFEVERSNDGINWRKISETKGAGNTTQRHEYSIVDTDQPERLNYYRLKQIDFSGQIEYSKIVSVTTPMNENQQLKIYPNPASKNVTIEGLTNDINRIHLLNSIGTVIKEFNIITNETGSKISFNVENLPEGLYFLQCFSTEDQINRQVTRLIIKH